MNRQLSFLKCYINKEAQPIGDIFNNPGLLKDVPNERGIYIIVAQKEKFVYPKKKSPVLYVGMSKRLRTRLRQHVKRYNEAKDSFKAHDKWVYSRYNYIVAFEGTVYYMRITGKENEKSLESKALEGFFDVYGALPVGNGALSYKKSR